MEMSLIVLLVVVFVISASLYSLYVKVIKCKNSVREALSGIDVQLRKRYDLIPNILTIAQRFMEHETELFDKITQLRTQALNAKTGTKEKFNVESELDTQLRALMVNVENYPTLKSDATMVQAMQTYNEAEEHIAAARRFYNSALRELKNTIEIFPGSLFASYAKDAADLSFFETDEESRKPVNAGDYLKK
jgi:LemA protein